MEWIVYKRRISFLSTLPSAGFSPLAQIQFFPGYSLGFFIIHRAWISSSGKRKENVNRWKSYFLQEKQPVCEVLAWLFFFLSLSSVSSVWLLEFSKSVNTLFERNGGQSLFEVKHNCSKASNYTALSNTGLADTRLNWFQNNLRQKK